jgi:predicted nucleic acid-binding protein
LARYFIDTSALAKLYRRELGSDFIDRILAESGSQLFVSRLALVEMESVFALKTRTGEINQQALVLARRRDAGLATVFVAADQRLCRVAALEGFAVANPEQPASLVT